MSSADMSSADMSSADMSSADMSSADMSSAHALLSASAAHRWLNCPPSVRLTEHLPDAPSEHAERGTVAHAIAELKLRKYCTPVSMRSYNAALKKLTRDPLYEPSMASGTDLYMDHIKAVATAYPSEVLPAIFAERRVDYSHVAPEGFGTADCIIVGCGDLHIIDYKNGAGVKVGAEENPQLKLYALGAMREFELLYDIERVHLTIVQPNNGGVSTWATTPDALRTWAKQVRPIAQAAFEGEGECQGGDWCRFCKLSITCPARREAFNRFVDLTVSKPDPTVIPPDELGQILDNIDPVARWMTKVREYAQEQIILGAEIPGWKTVEGTSNRAWIDQEAAFKTLISRGVDEALLYKREPLSLAAVETTVGKKAFADLVGQFILKPPGQPKLAAATDKRPPFTGRAPEQVFENMEGNLL